MQNSFVRQATVLICLPTGLRDIGECNKRLTVNPLHFPTLWGTKAYDAVARDVTMHGHEASSCTLVHAFGLHA